MDPEPDPEFHSNVDPDPTSLKNADPQSYLYLDFFLDVINLTVSAGNSSDHHHRGGLPRRRYIHRLRCQGNPLMLPSSC